MSLTHPFQNGLTLLFSKCYSPPASDTSHICILIRSMHIVLNLAAWNLFVNADSFFSRWSHHSLKVSKVISLRSSLGASALKRSGAGTFYLTLLLQRVQARHAPKMHASEVSRQAPDTTSGTKMLVQAWVPNLA